MADKVGFLVILRAVCCLLIIYGHLIADQNPQWFVVPLINRYLTDPLGVLSNLGFLAVGIFFLISGFIITHVAQRETRTDFVIKRVFRIFPPFLVVVFFLAALGRICNVPEIAAMSGADVLREASLFDSSFELVGPSWTLVIEVMFYALAAVLLPMFRSRPFAITAIVAMVPIIDRLMLSDAIAASGVGQFKVLLDFQNYLSVFAIGMAIYYAWSGKLTVRKAVLLGAMAWCALVWTMPQAADGTGVPINQHLLRNGRLRGGAVGRPEAAARHRHRVGVGSQLLALPAASGTRLARLAQHEAGARLYGSNAGFRRGDRRYGVGVLQLCRATVAARRKVADQAPGPADRPRSRDIAGVMISLVRHGRLDARLWRT